jgi:hypothetical protein
MRLLQRLRQDVARREVEVLSVILGHRLREHRDERPDGVLPDVALVAKLPIEGVQLCRRRALPDPELHAPVAHEIER